MTRVFSWWEKLGCTGSDRVAGRRQCPEQVGRQGRVLLAQAQGWELGPVCCLVIAAEKGGGQEPAMRLGA